MPRCAHRTRSPKNNLTVNWSYSDVSHEEFKDSQFDKLTIKIASDDVIRNRMVARGNQKARDD